MSSTPKLTISTSTFPSILEGIAFGTAPGENLYTYIKKDHKPPMTADQRRIAYDKLNEIFKTHSIDTNLNIKCPCFKVKTIVKGELSSHIHNSHIQYLPFPCSKCSRIFFSARSLTRHDQNIHKDKQPLQNSQQGASEQPAKKPKLELKNSTIALPPSSEDLSAATILQQLSPQQGK